MLIENLYAKVEVDLGQIFSTKVSALSGYQKRLLLIDDFVGNDNSNLYDACFVLMIPPQLLAARYKRFVIL